MRKSAIAVIAATSIAFATPALAAEKSQRNETIGVGSGAIIGAFAGGPLGFVIGAAIGAKIGDNIDKKNDRIVGLEQSVDDSKAYVARLEENLDTLGAEVERLQGLSRHELIDLMQAGIEMDILFRTDEDVLTDTTGDRLAQLAGTLSSMPDIHIQLDGFADERGSSDYNQGLSERRVQFIRDQLVVAGIHPNRINMSAHGESAAQDQSTDSYALERRVSVKLFLDNSPSLASN